MHFLKKISTSFYLGFLAILLLTLGGTVVAAFADSSTSATVAVNAGQLSESGPSNVQATPITLNGTDQTTSYEIPLTVTDATGSGAGWHMTIKTESAQFTDSATSHSFTPGSYQVTGTLTACQAKSTCTAPIITGTDPVSIGTSANVFYDVSANTGLGSFSVTPAISFVVPANTLADSSYSNTVDIAIVAGP